MAGKSTFLRQNALIAVLAQIGLASCRRARPHIGIVDRLFSRVGAADDLARGRSTFMVEMVETAAILNQATPRSLVILDEIGRGTATYDGLSIAWAVLEYLHEVNRCRALFATHYHELTALAGKLPRAATPRSRSRSGSDEIVFLHEVATARPTAPTASRWPSSPACRPRSRPRQRGAESCSRRPTAGPSLSLRTICRCSARPKRLAVEALPRPRAVEQALQGMSPDAMTPKEALEALYRLKGLAG